MENFRQGKDLIRCSLQKDHAGCCVEKQLRAKSGNKETRKMIIEVFQKRDGGGLRRAAGEDGVTRAEASSETHWVGLRDGRDDRSKVQGEVK